MHDPAALLRRHAPKIVYDSQEAYFADSAAEWTDNPGNVLVGPKGEVIAAATPASGQSRLSLGFLGPRAYENVSADDAIGDPGHDYRRQYAKLHPEKRYRNRIYGRAATDRKGALWLQYWFWYFYNDASFLGFGLHEGDWEMIQLRIGDDGRPDTAVYAQHRHAGSRQWSEVEKAPGSDDVPVVYSARGSHASYFETGSPWTGVWFDHADGKGASPELTLEVIGDDDPPWVAWPGHWGGTRARDVAESDSPTAPSQHAQWRDPLHLLDTAESRAVAPPAPPPGRPPPAPTIEARRVGDALEIDYSAPAPADGPPPTQLVVNLNSPDDPLPPHSHSIAIDSESGTVRVPVPIETGKSYEVKVSAGNELGASGAVARSIGRERDA
jgi:hypothetical protein